MLKVLFMILLTCSVKAQIKLKVNGKLVTENTTIKAEEIKTIEVGFDKYKPMDYYGLGRVFLFVELLNENNVREEKCYMMKEGTNAIKAFLDDKNVFYPLKSDTHPNANFYGEMIRTDDQKIVTKLKFLGRDDECKQVKLGISMYFREKLGYEKFGEPIDMIKEQYYTIDNTVFYTEAQKEKEQEKIIKAEKEKQAEQDRIQNEIKEKAQKKKGLLKSILNKI